MIPELGQFVLILALCVALVQGTLPLAGAHYGRREWMLLARPCAQVLFLDSEKSQYIEELGGMNVVFVYKDGRVVTPESSSILEGITLDSILQLAKDRGLTVEQRKVTIDEVREGVASGDIVEMFACGTAAVVVPIAQFKADSYTIGEANSPAGELTLSLRQELTDIQYGKVVDRHGWLTRLDA